MSCSADDRDIGGLEAGLEAEHRERDLPAAATPCACGQDATGVRLSEPVLGEHMAPCARASPRSTAR